MTEKETSKALQKDKVSVDPAATSVKSSAPASPPPSATKRKGRVYTVIALVLLGTAAVVVWQERQPGGFLADNNKKDVSSMIATQSPTVQNSEELNRFRIIKQELTELRASHEALSKAFLESQKQINELKTRLVETSVTQDNINPPSIPVATASPVASHAIDVDAQKAIATLTSRLDALQKQYDTQSGLTQNRLKTLAIADDIQAKLNSGDSFAQEFSELKALQGDENAIPRAAVFTLQQNAEQGVATLAELMSDFDDATQLAIPAGISSQQKQTFGDKLRAQLSHLVTIRRVDVEDEDDSDEANIARAEAELRAGNVDMAITHLQQLSSQPKTVFIPWIKQANAYLDTREAVVSIKALALQKSAPVSALPDMPEFSSEISPIGADPAHTPTE